MHMFQPCSIPWQSPTDRRLFEGVQHPACVIPLAEYRYQLPRQRRVREEPSINTRRWLADPNNNTLLGSVFERIRQEGALRTSDFEGDGHKRNSWWDWKPAKHALELLYARGDLMIDRARQVPALLRSDRTCPTKMG